MIDPWGQRVDVPDWVESEIKSLRARLEAADKAITALHVLIGTSPNPSRFDSRKEFMAAWLRWVEKAREVTKEGR